MSPQTEVPFPLSAAFNREALSTSLIAEVQRDLSQSDNESERIPYLPGNPTVSLLPDEVHHFLTNELSTPLLDELYERLWLVSTKSFSNIDALHAQNIKGRSVIPTEDPRLHLVWTRDRVYVKPVPVYLVNYEVWIGYLSPLKPKSSYENVHDVYPPTSLIFDRSVAIGFLRPYAFLVKHQLDFKIAKDLHLIPDDIDWIQWSKFIDHFRHIRNDRVSPRYHYGQLRLSRLNWVVRIFRPSHALSRWTYEKSHWSTSEFVAKATFPLAFVFASLSVALSSMQVSLSVPVDSLWYQDSTEYKLRRMNQSFWVFSIAVVLLWLFIWAIVLGFPLFTLTSQFFWALKNRRTSDL